MTRIGCGFLCALSLALVLSLDSCGGGGGDNPNPSPPPAPVVSVTISPATASVSLGATQQFSASVSGSSNTGVIWQVNGTTGGSSTLGTVSASGLYTAPDKTLNPASVTVTAIAQADPAKTAAATVTVVSNVSVSLTPSSITVPAGSAQPFTATTQNDPGKLGVTWAVNGVGGGSPSTGTITSSGLYTAPLSPPAGGAVTVTAISVADSTKSASASIVIDYSNASLSGQYAFIYSGATTNGSELAAGSFIADGAGNLTSGIEDLNTPSGIFEQQPFTGSYSVGVDGRGTATLQTKQGLSAFKFVMTTNKHAMVIAFDSSDVGTGALDQQDSSSFSTSALKGGYAFGLIGYDPSFNPLALAGEFTADGAGNITAGLEDINDNGKIEASQSFSGTYTVGAQGRGTATITQGGATSTYAFYVISANQLDFVETDSHPGVAGTAFQQSSSSFSNASLSGNYVFLLAGFPTEGFIAAGGLFKADGSGNIPSGTEDENDRGSVTLNSAVTGNYTIASNGRGTATLSVGGQTVDVTFYMISTGLAEFLETDASSSPVVLGSAVAQQQGPFSNSTLKGHYAFTLAGPAGNTVLAGSGQIIPDGNGNLAGTEDLDNGGALSPSLALSGTFTISSTGRGTASVANSQSTSNFVVYIASPSQVLFLSTDSSDIEVGLATLQY